MKAQLEVLQCPFHGLIAVAINDRRISPSKCCGRWQRMIGWTTEASNIRDAIPRAKRKHSRRAP